MCFFKKISFNCRLISAVILISSLIMHEAVALAEDKVVYCRSNSALSALAVLAESRGFFKEVKIQASFKTENKESACMELLAKGTADMSVVDDLSYLTAIGSKSPLVGLGIVHAIGGSNESDFKKTGVLASSLQVRAERPWVIDRSLIAILKAEDYINRNKDQAFGELANLLSFNKEALAKYWSLYPHKLSFAADEISALKDKSKTIQAQKPFDEELAIDPSFLRAIAPARVK